MQPSDEILAVRGLSKTYVTFKKEPGLVGGVKALFKRERVPVPAVKDLTFSIRRGEFVGLLGPNGAGKTTTLKMLTGLIAPSSGAATAFGSFDTAKRTPAYLRRIGMVMGQRNQLTPDLPAMDSFRLAQAIYGLPDQQFKRRLDTCVDLFGIEDKILTPVRKLSLGERMKMELILAILHEPELLFLDEPTIGLDFNAARQIRSFLADANAKLGITVVLTSHYTKDIEELCRRVVVINHGRIYYDGPLTGLDERVQGEKIVTLVCVSEDAAEQARKVLGNARTDGATVSFDVPVKHAAAATQDAIAKIGGDQIVDLTVGERPLDEIFAELYRRPKEDLPGAGP
jgi:ABC-2 type transport system ATP-binding protein